MKLIDKNEIAICSQKSLSAFTHPISELKTRFNGQQEDVFACTIGPSHFEQSMQALSSLIPPVVFPNFPKGKEPTFRYIPKIV